MPPARPTRSALLSDLADHVLEHGLNTASLRPMAKAAGTSDRMLIYHFGSKEALIAELLAFLADRMAEGLDQALPDRRFQSEGALVGEILRLMRSDPFAPYVRLWLDIVSAAAQGSAVHREAGHGILEIYRAWLARRHPDGDRGAPRALALIEGVLVMDAVGQKAIADAALSQLGGQED